MFYRNITYLILTHWGRESSRVVLIIIIFPHDLIEQWNSYIFGIVQSCVSLEGVNVCSSWSCWGSQSNTFEAVSSLWRAQWPANLNLLVRIVSLTVERLPNSSWLFICCWPFTAFLIKASVIFVILRANTGYWAKKCQVKFLTSWLKFNFLWNVNR